MIPCAGRSGEAVGFDVVLFLIQRVLVADVLLLRLRNATNQRDRSVFFR